MDETQIRKILVGKY